MESRPLFTRRKSGLPGTADASSLETRSLFPRGKVGLLSGSLEQVGLLWRSRPICSAAETMGRPLKGACPRGAREGGQGGKKVSKFESELTGLRAQHAGPWQASCPWRAELTARHSYHARWPSLQDVLRFVVARRRVASERRDEAELTAVERAAATWRGPRTGGPGASHDPLGCRRRPARMYTSGNMRQLLVTQEKIGRLAAPSSSRCMQAVDLVWQHVLACRRGRLASSRRRRSPRAAGHGADLDI